MRQSVAALEAAALWRDPQALYKLHVDSQGQGVLCDANFQRLFDKARAEHTPDTCRGAQQVATLPPAQRATLDEADLLLAELIAFQCDAPQAPCADFARDLFERRALASPLLTRPLQHLTTQRVVFSSPAEATAYVEASFTDAPQPERLTLYLAKGPQADRWRFTTYPW